VLETETGTKYTVIANSKTSIKPDSTASMKSERSNQSVSNDSSATTKTSSATVSGAISGTTVVTEVSAETASCSSNEVNVKTIAVEEFLVIEVCRA